MFEVRETDWIGNIHNIGGSHERRETAEREAELRNIGRRKERAEQGPWWRVVDLNQ